MAPEELRRQNAELRAELEAAKKDGWGLGFGVSGLGFGV